MRIFLLRIIWLKLNRILASAYNRWRKRMIGVQCTEFYFMICKRIQIKIFFYIPISYSGKKVDLKIILIGSKIKIVIIINYSCV